MGVRSVLVSGAGIAGSTLAYWLGRHGFEVTVVERSTAVRSSGNPVDVRGPAVEVAERMGVMKQLRDASTEVTSIGFVDSDGRLRSRIDLRAMQAAAASREVEVPRADLASILSDAARDCAAFVYGDRIVALSDTGTGVEVTFDKGPARTFDLVIGADGLHSGVRRLAFGPESAFTRFLGMYVATVPLGRAADDPHRVLMYNVPGASVSIHPARGRAIAAFMFRRSELDAQRRQGADGDREVVEAAFAGKGWLVPELLGRLNATDDFYFDAVSQVRLPSWHRGRVALLGDAASCVSLFGEGSSLAIAGAATLAASLAAHPADHSAALLAYEKAHRALVAPKQRGMRQAARIMVPSTRAGIGARNLAVRLLPLAARLSRPRLGRARTAEGPAPEHAPGAGDSRVADRP